MTNPCNDQQSVNAKATKLLREIADGIESGKVGLREIAIPSISIEDIHPRVRQVTVEWSPTFQLAWCDCGMLAELRSELLDRFLRTLKD